MQKYIEYATTIQPRLIRRESYVYTWPDVVTLIEDKPALIDAPYAAEAKRIISLHREDPVASLRKANDGRVWRWLANDVFPLMRKTTITGYFNGKGVVYYGEPEIQQPEIEETVETEVVEVVEAESVIEYAAQPEWTRHVYLKTNLPAWLCLWINAAFEVDIVPHWSFTLPVYYSGFNYFTRTLKFRTFAVQPEFRWFPNRDNRGFFAGIHAGLVYYNIALKGDIRYQDHDTRTPALGGGVSVGYRFRLNSNPHLYMEATVGAGIYRLHYDEYLNYYNGLKVGERKRTFYGIDQAALSFVYQFDCRAKNNEKGGTK